MNNDLDETGEALNKRAYFIDKAASIVDLSLSDSEKSSIK
jgi:hypothetical protein